MSVAHKGSISMGMVLIPIGLYKTTVDNDKLERIKTKKYQARLKDVIMKKI